MLLKLNQRKLAVLISISALISATLACNMPGVSATSSPDPISVAGTSAAETAISQITRSAQIPTQPILPTATFFPTSTQQPPTLTPSLTPVPCNQAVFVSDVNYPDKTAVLPATSFSKTWRLQNTGSCTWTSGYSVVYVQGDRMGAPDFTPVTSGTVASGAQVDISVPLVAPSVPGTYHGDFMLRAPDGTQFGIGPAGNNVFWAEIIVPAPTSTPTSTFTPTSTPTLLILIPSIAITLISP